MRYLAWRTGGHACPGGMVGIGYDTHTVSAYFTSDRNIHILPMEWLHGDICVSCAPTSRHITDYRTWVVSSLRIGDVR